MSSSERENREQTDGGVVCAMDPSIISFRNDFIGIIGVTLMVALLMAPVLDGSRTLMSDSWRLNYPWAVEQNPDAEALREAVGDLGSGDTEGAGAIRPAKEEPYVLAYDIYLEQLPWYAFAKSEIFAGRWPHWNPHSFCGAPFYANHLVPLTHPPLLVALIFAPVQQIHTVATFLTLWLGGIGFYFYLRKRRLQPIAGLTGVALYLGSGHFMPLVAFQLASVVYFPWLLLVSDNLEEKPTFKNLSIFAIVLGLQMAAGHPAFVVPFIYFIVVYRILIWVFGRKNQPYWKPRAGMLILAFVLGGLLSAVQNYPTWEFVKDSPRDLVGQTERTLYDEEGLDPQKVEAGAVGRPNLEKFTDLVAPVFTREIEVQHKYAGIPLLLLAFLGLIFMKPAWERKVFLIILMVFGILAFRPVFNVIAYYIPGLAISPYTPYEPFQMIGFILAAIGVNRFVEGLDFSNRRWISTFIILTGAGLGIFVWLFMSRAVFAPETRWAAEQLTLGWIVLITGVISIIIPVVSLLSAKRAAFIGGFLLPLAVTTAAIIGHVYQYPVFPEVPVMPVTRSMGAIPQDTMYRVIRYTSGSGEHAASMENPLTFGGNLPMWAGYMDSQGYDSFVVSGQWEMLKNLERESLIFNGLALPLKNPLSLLSPFLDAMAVKWVISDDPDLLEKYEFLRDEYTLIESRGLVVYERTNPLPRWYLRQYITDGSSAEESSLGRITPIRENPQRIEFRVEAERDCVLVLSDVNFPEWKANVDGESAEIYMANGAYRAVEVAAGAHSVVFQYEARAFRIGAGISLAVLVLLFVGMMVEKSLGARRAPLP